MLKVFFDADILFSLSYTRNPNSGTKRILLQGHLEKYAFITSVAIIKEAKENLFLYKNPYYLKKLSELLRDFNFQIIEIVDEKLVNLYKNIVHIKDAHVLAAAIQSQSNYLLTFNRKHFMIEKFKEYNLELQVFNPKEFINKVILKSDL